VLWDEPDQDVPSEAGKKAAMISRRKGNGRAPKKEGAREESKEPKEEGFRLPEEER
jgi:hypothetical protein